MTEGTTGAARAAEIPEGVSGGATARRASGQPARAMPELLKRIVFAVVAAPIAVWAIVAGGAAFAVLLSALAGAGAWELYRMARADGMAPIDGIGIPLAAAVPLVVAMQPRGVFVIPPWLVAGSILLVFAVAIWRRRGDGRPLSAVATTLFGACYTGGLLSFAAALRYHPYVADDRGGTVLVLLPVVLTWGNDIGAYAVGRLVGGPKLLPAVSPGKTIAGAIGGLAAAVLVCWWYASHVLVPWAQLGMRPVVIVLFALAVGVAGQIGDLAESLLKREAGFKNSSGLFPGHGGVLDRLDSLLFALPLAYVLLDLPGVLLPVPLAGQP